MIAFEIRINGNPLYTIGIGEYGSFNVMAMYTRIQSIVGSLVDDISIWAHGSKASKQALGQSVEWQRWYLDVGDEITIRIIETDRCDEGEPTSPPASRN